MPRRQVSFVVRPQEGFGMRLLWVENHAVFARMAGRQFLPPIT